MAAGATLPRDPRMSAMSAVTWGAAIEVPDLVPHVDGGIDDQMLEPGAATSTYEPLVE